LIQLIIFFVQSTAYVSKPQIKDLARPQKPIGCIFDEYKRCEQVSKKKSSLKRKGQGYTGNVENKEKSSAKREKVAL
jgi:hypothetical protein